MRSEEAAPKQRTLEGDIKELCKMLGRKLAPFFVPVEGQPELRAGGRSGETNVAVSLKKDDNGKMTGMIEMAGDPPFDHSYSVRDLQTHTMDAKGAKLMREFLQERYHIDYSAMKVPEGYGYGPR